jgi:hypothetical protein
MKNQGARAQRRSAIHVWSAVILVLLGMAIIVAVGYRQLTRDDPIDPVTLCPAKGPAGHTVLLVDKTDPLNFTQKQAFSVRLQNMVTSEIPEGHLLSVFVLGESFQQSAVPILELCNPGSEQGKSELTANLKRLQTRFEERFIKPVRETEELLVATAPAKVSPIFEMIQLVGINGFQKHAIQGKKRLLMMSDMIHNTPQFSMYSGNFDFEYFSKTDYGSKSMANLQGVDVNIIYLLNTPRLQTRRQAYFWEQYFERAGAKLSNITPLEG